MKQQRQISIQSYCSDGFLREYQELIRDVVLPYQYQVLCDSVEGAEKSYVMQNFINAGKALRGELADEVFRGMVFQDSDVAKWLEAAAYVLAVTPNSALSKQADALIALIAAAQDTDGYLNTYFTIQNKEKRWKNLMEGHELYCAGHMMEAAVAYYEATGKDTLLQVMQRNVAHIYQYFIEEQHPGYPGHPEVELALLKMYRITGNPQCLTLARHFIDVRGVDPHFYETEAANRDWTVWGNDPYNHAYQQCEMPVREQSTATGHSVRAVYLYTAMADLASEISDVSLEAACNRLWKNIVQRRMYVTGAIGSTAIGEAFTVDYNLPNDTVYGETCASIGLLYFASRMLELSPDSAYADVMERAFYNIVLAGMQLDGKRFFYVNPLEVVPGISGTAVTHRHVLTTRPAWYTCACCPPNVARTIASIGKYAYGENETTAFCHLFAAGTISFENGMRLRCETGYPYAFTITYQVECGGRALAIRIPGWSNGYQLVRNGVPIVPALRAGYAYLPVLQTGDVVTLTLDDSVHRIYTSTRVPNNAGCVALQRGPLIYCVEGVDHGGDVLSLSIPETAEITVSEKSNEQLGGSFSLHIAGMRTMNSEALYTMQKPEEVACEITAIPYYTWGNRGETQMRVWLPEGNGCKIEQ